ncbi:MAG: DUF2069 domain-containing protein [Pseudomonadales bacterium]|nr:DUF2069 domain-containing protein [Pseudomonadales bacterium]
MSASSPLSVRICRTISALSYVLLIGILFWFIATGANAADGFPWKVLAFYLLPLLIFIPGLLKGTDRTHAWMCFVVLVYFTLGILELFSRTNKLEGAFITLFSTTLFISSTLYIRWHKPE